MALHGSLMDAHQLTENMTPDQFAALAKLTRLRASPSAHAACLVLVDQLPISDAAKEAGLPYAAAQKAVLRMRKALDLAKQATT